MKDLPFGPEVGKSQNAGLLAKVKPSLFHNWFFLVAGLIVLGLSAGAFPLAWTRLIQMIRDRSTLQAASGSAMYAPFVILLLQVVCFLVAWAILVLVIVREVLAYKDDSGQVQGSSSVSSAGPPSMQASADAVILLDNADEYIPFDMNAAIFELLPDQDEVEPGEEEEELFAPVIVEEEAVFVYGDPLAGDLPEIFNYDIDLMSDVQDHRAKVVQAQSIKTKSHE